MEVQITARHGKVSSGLKETIVNKFNKMEKFHEKITWCHCILDTEHTDDICEIVINTRGKTLSAKAKADNTVKSLDDALAKIERQLKKENDRIKNHKAPKVGPPAAEPSDDEDEEIE